MSDPMEIYRELSGISARLFSAKPSVFFLEPRAPSPKIDPIPKSADQPVSTNHQTLAHFTPQPKPHAPWKLNTVIAAHTGWVRAIAVDPSNDFFASASVDRTIKIFSLPSCEVRLTLTGHVSPVRALEFSKRHVYLFSAGEDKDLRCWDLNTNQCIRTYHGHLSGVYSIALHPTHDVLVSGGRDAAVRLWDIRTRNNIMVFEGHKDAINVVKAQDDEPQIISGSADQTIRLWDILTGKRFAVLTEHKKGIRDIVLHPSENCLLSIAADDCKIFELSGARFLRNIERKLPGILNCGDILDDDLVAIGSDSGQLGLWDWQSGQCVQVLSTPKMPGSISGEEAIFDVAFDHSGLRMITAECDKTLKVFEKVVRPSEVNGSRLVNSD